MGINIGICETEAKNALCKDLKKDIISVKVNDPKGFEDVVAYDEIVTLENAHELFGDWEAFMKRNRINAETDAIYLDKIKNDADLDILKSKSEKVCTGWIDTKKLDGQRIEEAISASSEENRRTGWDLLEFDEMSKMCSECPVSWDKGRGCIGSFGPDNSLLPEIAERRGCKIVGSVPTSAASRRIYGPDDAKELLREIEILETALPEEGKMMVRRYSGPLERMKAVAEISVSEECGFYFF